MSRESRRAAPPRAAGRVAADHGAHHLRAHRRVAPPPRRRAAFVRAIGRTFPGVKQATENVLDPKASLNELRSQIWNLRTEFWLRKITTYPQVYQAAKVRWRRAGSMGERAAHTRAPRRLKGRG